MNTIRQTWVALLTAGLLSPVLAQDLPGPAYNPTTTTNGLSIMGNPAGLGVDHGPESFFYYRYNDMDATRERHEFSFSLNGDGLALSGHEYWDGGTYGMTRLYRAGLGFEIRNGVYMGARGNFWARGIDVDPTVDYGVLFTPWRFAALGVYSTNLFEKNDDYRDYQFGLALRPLMNHKLTLGFSAQLMKTETVEYGDKLNYSTNLNFCLVDGLSLFGQYKYDALNDDNIVTAGLRINDLFDGTELLGQQYDGGEDGSAGQMFTIGSHSTEDKLLSIGRAFTKTPTKFIELKLAGPLTRFKEPGGLFQKSPPSVESLIDQIEQVQDDPAIAGIFLNLKSPKMGQPARKLLMAALQEYKDSGHKIIAYAENVTLGTWQLASIANKLYIPETGGMDLVGIKIEGMFYAGLLDKLGVEYQVVHAGKYKSAMEPFYLEGFSEPSREALHAVIEDIYDVICEDIAKNRGVSTEDVINILNNGPYNFYEAMDAGLINGSLYYNDRKEVLAAAVNRDEIDLMKWSDYKFADSYDWEWDEMKQPGHIALIKAEGAVVNQENPTHKWFKEEKQITYRIARQLKQAREDKNIDAVVMWVDSGGGAVLASDVIYHEMEQYHDEDVNKPIIVVMGRVAGSGGYYISCQADEIVAAPETITGSIGVISGKPNIKKLLAKVGISTDTIKFGDHSNMSSLYEPWSEDEYGWMRKTIDAYYDLFLDRVAAGRHMDKEDVHKVAQGRIWSGRDALEIGLIDQLGDLNTGLEIARERAGLGDDYELVDYSSKEHSITLSAGLSMALVPESVRNIAARLDEFEQISDGTPQFRMPLRITVE